MRQLLERREPNSFTPHPSQREVMLPYYSVWMAAFYFACGPIIVIVVGLILLQANVPSNGVIYGLPPALLYMIIRGRRLLGRTASEALARDQRAPILYLRAFSDDSDEAGKALPRTVESRFVRKLEAVGPVIAIGEPGEEIRHLGAIRLYVSDAQWKGAAFTMMQGSRMVVIRLAATDGIKWELQTLRGKIDPGRVVLWVTEGWKKSRSFAEEAFGVQLPKDLHGRVFIAFTANWEPVTVLQRLGENDSFDRLHSHFQMLNERPAWVVSLAKSLPEPKGAAVVRQMVEALDQSARVWPRFRILPSCWLAWASLAACMACFGQGLLPSLFTSSSAAASTALSLFEAIVLLLLAIHVSFGRFLAGGKEIVSLRQAAPIGFLCVLLLEVGWLFYSGLAG